MIFDDILGQERVKHVLTESVSADKIGHAYLFHGPDGVGRKSMAFRFAALLLCTGSEKETDREPGGPEYKACSADTCKCCQSCILYKNGTNPDIRLIGEQDGKSTVGVEAIRDLQEDILTAPLYGRRKVYIIDRSERLTPQAQNALLKTIEEPPSYAVIILICSNISLILDTVKSRVVKIDFTRNSDEEVRQAFLSAADSEGGGLDLNLVCAYADGVIGRALEFHNTELYQKLRRDLFVCLERLTDGKEQSARIIAELFTANDQCREYLFFSLLSFLRDIMLESRFGKNAKLQNRDMYGEIYDLSRDIGYHKAMRCIQIADDTWRLLSRNVNYKLAVESMLIKLQEVVA